MGQPTSGLLQRVGRSQLWQHTPFLSLRERGFAEHQARFHFGTRFAALYFQSLVFNSGVNLWAAVSSLGYLRVRAQLRWLYILSTLPANKKSIRARYIISAPAKFLLFDGENVFYSIPYKHRQLRLNTLFWAQPRILKIHETLVLSLRCFNATEPRRRRPRKRLAHIRRIIPWLGVGVSASLQDKRVWF